MFRGPWTNQNAWDSIVAAKAAQWRVPPALIKGVIGVESGYVQQPGASGERGLMQIMPATARGLGFEGPLDMLYDADLNIGLGARLLSENFRQARGKWDAAISAYNAGWSRARPYDGKRSGDGSFSNQRYVDDVVDGWEYFNRQSLTPTVGQPAFVVSKPTGKPGATVTRTAGGGLAIAAAAGLAALLLLRR
jgi:hypothetical protein